MSLFSQLTPSQVGTGFIFDLLRFQSPASEPAGIVNLTDIYLKQATVEQHMKEIKKPQCILTSN